MATKQYPLDAEDACLWLGQATIEEADVQGTVDGDVLRLTREDGSVLLCRATSRGELVFSSEVKP